MGTSPSKEKEKEKEKAILLYASLLPSSNSGRVKSSLFIVKHAADGSKIYKILHPHPLEIFKLLPCGPSCALVGSSLYVLGDGGSIYSINTLNPADGLKTAKSSLPFAYASAVAQVMDNLILIFPQLQAFNPLNSGIKNLWGYAFDTVEEKGYPIQPPPPTSPSNDISILGIHDCCGVLDERGILVPVSDKLYLYDVRQKSWELWDTCIPFPRYKIHSTYSNGIFYFCDPYSYDGCWILRVYDARSCHSFQVELPISDRLYGSLSLVAVADFKLCFMWHIESCLYYRKVLVSESPSPSAIVLEKKCFDNLEFHGLIHCQPIDSVPSSQDLEEISEPNSTELEMGQDSLLRYKTLPEDHHILYQQNQRMMDFLPRKRNISPPNINFPARNSLHFSNRLKLASSAFYANDVPTTSIPNNSGSAANMYSGSNISKFRGYLTRGLSVLLKLFN